jgi:hypothetical protein
MEERDKFMPGRCVPHHKLNFRHLWKVAQVQLLG